MTSVGDFDGQTTWGAKETGGDGEYLVRVGTENRQHVLGHISLLGYRGSIIAPMTTGGPDESALGDPIEVLLTEWARQCKKQGGLVILPHFPFPRAEHPASIISGDVDALDLAAVADGLGENTNKLPGTDAESRPRVLIEQGHRLLRDCARWNATYEQSAH